MCLCVHVCACWYKRFLFNLVYALSKTIHFRHKELYLRWSSISSVDMYTEDEMHFPNRAITEIKKQRHLFHYHHRHLSRHRQQHPFLTTISGLSFWSFGFLLNFVSIIYDAFRSQWSIKSKGLTNHLFFERIKLLLLVRFIDRYKNHSKISECRPKVIVCLFHLEISKNKTRVRYYLNYQTDSCCEKKNTYYIWGVGDSLPAF